MGAKTIGDTVVYLVSGTGFFVVKNHDYSAFGFLFLLVGVVVIMFAVGCIVQYKIENLDKTKKQNGSGLADYRV